MKERKFERGVGCGVLLGVLLVSLLVLVPSLIIWEIIGESSLLDAITELLLYLGLGVVVLVVARHFGISLAVMTGRIEHFTTHIKYAVWVFPLIAIALGAIFITMATLAAANESWFYWYLRQAEYMELYMELVSESMIPYTITIIAMVVVGPVVEEYLFRGLLLSSWGIKWGATRAILLSSFLFGILHMDPIGAFIFGVVLSLIYYHTGSLLLVILIHILNNALVVVLMQLPELIRIETPADVHGYLLYSVVLAVVAGLMIAPTVRRIWPAKDARPPVAR